MLRHTLRCKDSTYYWVCQLPLVLAPAYFDTLSRCPRRESDGGHTAKSMHRVCDARRFEARRATIDSHFSAPQLPQHQGDHQGLRSQLVASVASLMNIDPGCINGDWRHFREHNLGVGHDGKLCHSQRRAH